MYVYTYVYIRTCISHIELRMTHVWMYKAYLTYTIDPTYVCMDIHTEICTYNALCITYG